MNRPTPVLTRRRWHQLGAAAALTTLLPGLSACASGVGDLAGYTVSQQRLNQLLAASFPVTRSFAGLADLTLQSPRLGLVLSERIAHTRYSGGMDLDYGLRFDMQEGAVRMTDVKVNRLMIDQLPTAQRLLVSQYAPGIAEQLLHNMVLYRLPAEQMALARNLGWGNAALRVLPQGLRIDMGPAGLR